jgi:hypothetical protein
MRSEQATVIIIAGPSALLAAAELALAGIAQTRFMARSFDQGPDRDHDVKGVRGA